MPARNFIGKGPDRRYPSFGRSAPKICKGPAAPGVNCSLTTPENEH